MSVPALNLAHLRREVASEFGLTIEPDDPVIVSAALAVMATRELLANERTKRADENLLTYKDVRHVLEDVRNDSLQFSQEIVGLALDQISKIIAAELAEERRSWALTINRMKLCLAASFGFAVAAIVF